MSTTSLDESAMTEEDLLNNIRSGKSMAEKLIYRRYFRHLSAICCRYILDEDDVKDVLQESFIKIFDSIGDFQFRGEGSIKAWVSKIVVNESLKFLRNNTRIKFSPLSESFDKEDPDYHDPDIEGIPTDVIYNLIRRLPDGYRMIFNLYVIEGKSNKEISSLLNIKESTSASQLHRAKAQLAENIRKYQLSIQKSV